MNCSQYEIELDEEPDSKYYMAMVSERSEHDHDLTVTIEDIIDYLAISNHNHNEAANS
jgi:hypothetical protein